MPKLLLDIIVSFASLGFLFGGTGYAWQAIRGGSKQQREDSVANLKFWKEQATEYKDIITAKDLKFAEDKKEMNEKYTSLSTKFGELSGRFDAESKSKAEYKAMLENKDPETKAFMSFMMTAAQNQAESHKGIMEVLKEIYRLTVEEHEKEFKLEGHITKQ